MLQAGVFHIHAGNGDNAVFVGYLASACASEAVAACVECGACNQDVGILLLDGLGDEFPGLVFVLAIEVVAADDGADDFDVASAACDTDSGAHGLACTELRCEISLVFAADAAEELV